MSDETRDPRTMVLDGIVDDAAKALLHATLTEPESLSTEMPYSIAAALRKLDAADPRLAMWGELVQTLEYIARDTYGTELCQTPEEQLDIIWGHFSAHQRKAREIVTRARALDATNQGGDLTLSDRGET